MLKSNTVTSPRDIHQSVIDVLKGNTAKTKGVTKSLRLDEDILRKIDQQATNSNNSLNAEINNILRKYVDWDMFASKVGMIPIARPILSEIFQNVMTKEQVIDLADKVAKNIVSEIVLFTKGSLTLESFFSWLKTRMQYCSAVNYWVEDNYNSISPQIKVIFKHDMGENWSLYHKIIIEHIFYEILGKKEVETEISGTTISLCFS